MQPKVKDASSYNQLERSADRGDIGRPLDRGGSATAFQQEYSPRHSRESRCSAILRGLHQITLFKINVGHTCVGRRTCWTCPTTKEFGLGYSQPPEVGGTLQSDSSDSTQGTLVFKHFLLSLDFL